MNRGQFLKSLGAIAGLAIAAPALDLLPIEEEAAITPELMEEIKRLLTDALLRDIDRMLWFGEPSQLWITGRTNIHGCDCFEI